LTNLLVSMDANGREAQMPEFAATTSIDKASASRLKEEIYRLSLFLARPEQIKQYFSTPYQGTNTSYRARER
jgi:hypothetical protein